MTRRMKRKLIIPFANYGTTGIVLSEQRVVRLINMICLITSAVTILITILVQTFAGIQLSPALIGVLSAAAFLLPVYLNFKNKHNWSKWVLVFLFNQVILTCYFIEPYEVSAWIVLISLFPLYVALFSHLRTVIWLSVATLTLISISMYLQSSPSHEPLIIYTKNQIVVKQMVYFLSATIGVLFLSAFMKSNLVDHKERLEETLNDREVLLKEVNHRVKNNMQLVSSILELQRIKVVNPNAKAILKNASERIKSLSLAHQSLYKNEDYESINIKEYIQLIINNLLHAERVQVSVDITDTLEIHIEKGQALGFVINELITNSLKHAWDISDSKKSVSISIRTNEENSLTLRYRDNGIGYPSGFKMNEQNSLGCTLINSFVTRQLEGKLFVSNDKGAITEIRLPKT